MALGRKKSATNNPQLADIIEKVKKEDIVPLHVQLPASLYKRTKMYAVEHEKSLKDLVILALEAYLPSKKRKKS